MGFSLLVVERGMEGFERGRKLDKIGLDAQDTAELSFTDVKVPFENLLGEEGSGFVYLMQNLPQGAHWHRVMAAAAMEAVLEETLQYTKERKAFGRPIGSQQNSRFLLAELSTEATVVRMMVDEFLKLHLEEKLTAEQPLMPSGTRPKSRSTSSTAACSCTAATATCANTPVARAYLDARVQTIYGARPRS